MTRAIENAPPVKLTLGKCEFSPVVGFECTCQAGQYISTLGVLLDQNASCEICGHRPLMHGGYEGKFMELHLSPGIPMVPFPLTGSYQTDERPQQETSPFKSFRGSEYSRRGKTIQKLVDLIEEERVIHVRGPPSSGKSTMAKLLHHYYTGKGETVAFIDEWSTKVRAADIITAKCRSKGYWGQLDGFDWGTGLIIIMDEAEKTYEDTWLWCGLIKHALRNHCSTRMCIFSSYGDPTAGPPLHEFPMGTTAPMIPPSKQVSLTMAFPSSKYRLGLLDVCLFYDAEEYEEVVDKYCKEASSRDNYSDKDIEFGLHTDLREYIFSLTSGHPGAVSSLLEYIHLFYLYGSRLQRQGVKLVTMDHVKEALDYRRGLCCRLEHCAVYKSLPSETNGVRDPSIINLLLDILKNGSVGYKNNDLAIDYCFRNGLVHTEMDDDYGMGCVFSSPLHALYVEHIYGRAKEFEFPIDNYPNPENLCEAIIREFCKQNLCDTRDGRRMGISGKKRAPETAFRDEFHRCLWNELPGAGIRSNWATTEGGSVDYYIPDVNWRIELLCDGEGLEECCSGFRENKGMPEGLKDWLILDCRHSVPGVTYPNEPRLWRVVFEDGYSRAHILDCQNREIVPEFAMVEEERRPWWFGF